MKESSESPTTLLYMARMMKSTTDDCTTSCELPVNMDSSSTEKCDVKTTSVTFFGTVYDKDEAHPDPKKVEAIHKMPPPEEPQELQKFLGMTTYLSPFIPSLSTFTAPLRELLQKDSEFTWNDSYQEAFDTVKQMVCKDTTLRYFDSRKPVVIQVNASQKGLGAALLQDGRPITFASKALTPTEQRYANIECEMLACVFGAERFHTYVFGRSFTIESDHKPLEQINLKNLADTPARLQKMLLRLQNYDVKIIYHPGREMLVADTLSRYARCPHRKLPWTWQSTTCTSPRRRSLHFNSLCKRTLSCVPWLKPSLLDGLRI